MYVPFCVFCFVALFCVLFVCICVLVLVLVLYCTVLYCTVLYCTVLLPPGGYPISVNKYIISHTNICNMWYISIPHDIQVDISAIYINIYGI